MVGFPMCLIMIPINNTQGDQDLGAAQQRAVLLSLWADEVATFQTKVLPDLMMKFSFLGRHSCLPLVNLIWAYVKLGGPQLPNEKL